MSFGQALESVIADRGESQEGPARAAFVSSSSISKYIKGTRKVPRDVMRLTTQHYDEAQLFIAAANEVTGGSFVPWLNNVDLHPANVHIKTMEEIMEAYEALRKAPITKRLDQLTAKETAIIQHTVMECIEATTALMHNVAVLCEEYGFSWAIMWKDHKQELKERKYLK